MWYVAIKMLVGDRAKYLGMLMGVTFACLLITHQEAVFVGIMTRTYSVITDLALPDIWVMDPKVQFIDDSKPLRDTQLYQVRGVDGVEWAVPLYKGSLRARLADGNFQACSVLGIDDATLIGGPPEMLEGRLEDLRQEDAVIVDLAGAGGRLAKPPGRPGEKPMPLKVGDVLELNDHRAVVVGVCRSSRSFQNQPILYTTYTRAMRFAPRERKMLSFILVKARPGQDQKLLCQRIEAATELKALTSLDFKVKTFWYFMKFTGIPINLGIAMFMSIIVGAAIAGQTFYTFTLENLRYFGTLKAMGAGNSLLFQMILLQAVMVGVIGYGIGVGAASVFGYFAAGTEAAWRVVWQLPILTAGIVVLICSLSAAICIRKVMNLEPAVVFRS